MKNIEQKINEMSITLEMHYDCISKLDACLFLKGIYPNYTVRNFMDAYYIAFPD